MGTCFKYTDTDIDRIQIGYWILVLEYGSGLNPHRWIKFKYRQIIFVSFTSLSASLVSQLPGRDGFSTSELYDKFNILV
jgi:hypothetical protein